MTEREKVVRELMDAWHQKVLDDFLENIVGIIANLPLEKTAPEMRLAAVNAVRNLVIGIG